MYNKKENHRVYNDKTGGYTLIEVLIAVAIFSIGIIGVGQMQLRSTSGNTNARIGTEASVWAQDQVETLMLLPYTHGDLNVGAHGPVNQGGYQIVWNVFTGATPPGSPLWGVTAAPNTKIVHVAVAGPKGTFRTNPSTITFVRGANY